MPTPSSSQRDPFDPWSPPKIGLKFDICHDDSSLPYILAYMYSECVGTFRLSDTSAQSDSSKPSKAENRPSQCQSDHKRPSEGCTCQPEFSCPAFPTFFEQSRRAANWAQKLLKSGESTRFSCLKARPAPPWQLWRPDKAALRPCPSPPPQASLERRECQNCPCSWNGTRRKEEQNGPKETELKRSNDMRLKKMEISIIHWCKINKISIWTLGLSNKTLNYNWVGMRQAAQTRRPRPAFSAQLLVALKWQQASADRSLQKTFYLRHLVRDFWMSLPSFLSFLPLSLC